MRLQLGLSFTICAAILASGCSDSNSNDAPATSNQDSSSSSSSSPRFVTNGQIDVAAIHSAVMALPANCQQDSDCIVVDSYVDQCSDQRSLYGSGQGFAINHSFTAISISAATDYAQILDDLRTAIQIVSQQGQVLCPMVAAQASCGGASPGTTAPTACVASCVNSVCKANWF